MRSAVTSEPTSPSTDAKTPTTFIGHLAEGLSDIGGAVLELTQGERRFRQVIEALPAAIYTTDAEGRITFYNEAAASLWGRHPALGELWCGSWRIYRPDGSLLPHDECPMAVALRTKQPVRGAEAVAERPDGTRVPFAPYPTPLFSSSGELAGAVNMLVDLTDRKRADENAHRLAAIVQSSDDAIISKDLNGIIQSWNNGAERLFGYRADEVIGKSIMILIPPDLRDEEPQILKRLRSGERIDHYETVRRRKDGALVDVSLTVSPIVDADGRIFGASKIARDIGQQKMLLGEILHRVKNTLANVQAIASQTLRHAPLEERDAFRARLRALSKAHDLLVDNKWDRAGVKEIVRTALQPFQSQQFVLDGPDIAIAPSQSLKIAMALHELGTNAAKYGALRASEGYVHLRWRPLRSGALRMSWTERNGPPVTRPVHKGFGSLLIERSFERARLTYGSKGFACCFDVCC
jgi:two-component system, chemotaxis family, CheB/CheR fusion protein